MVYSLGYRHDNGGANYVFVDGSISWGSMKDWELNKNNMWGPWEIRSFGLLLTPGGGTLPRDDAASATRRERPLQDSQAPASWPMSHSFCQIRKSLPSKSEVSISFIMQFPYLRFLCRILADSGVTEYREFRERISRVKPCVVEPIR